MKSQQIIPLKLKSLGKSYVYIFFGLFFLLIQVNSLFATKIPPPKAALDYKIITSLKSNPTLTGTASNLIAPLHLEISASSTGEILVAKNLDVNEERWSTTIYPPISVGEYFVTLSSGGIILDRGSLFIGATAPTLALDQTLAPYDVIDGHLMRFKIHATQNVKIAKLTFNLRLDAATIDTLTLYGFTDLLYSSPIIGETDGSIGTTEFDATSSIATTLFDPPIEIPAGSNYYFDLDGLITPVDDSYTVKTTLLGDKIIDFGKTFYDLKSTSNFIWSNNSLDLLDAGWINGSALPELLYGLNIERYATPVLSCDLEADTNIIDSPTEVTLSWYTTGANRVVFDDGSGADLSGSKTFVASSTHTYIIKLSGPLGPMQCSTTIVLNPTFVATPNTTPTGPPGAAFGSYTANPVAGTAPLSVSFNGSVNNNKSCLASIYNFGYGDKSTTTISVSNNYCKSKNFSLNHNYSSAGTYVSALYLKTATSSILVQTQTIMVNKKVASSSNLFATIYLAFKNLGDAFAGLLSKIKIFSVTKVTKKEAPIQIIDDESIEKSFQNEPEETPLPGALKIPILIYHSVRPINQNDSAELKAYEISPQLFERQLKYLKNNGFTAISLDDVANDLKNGTTTPGQKPVVLTFDDGWQNQYKYAFPLLKKYGMQATFYIFTNSINKNHFLSTSNIEEMENAGMIFESHSVSHPFFKNLQLDQVNIEMTNSKKTLEAILGKPVNHFASPYGYSNSDLIDLAKDAGYLTYRTTYKGVYQDNPLRLRGILVTASFPYFVQELLR